MIIKRVSILSGRTHVMDLDVTPEQLEAWAYEGKLAQDAMPNLTPEQREFIINGIIPEEFEAVFGKDTDE